MAAGAGPAAPVVLHGKQGAPDRLVAEYFRTLAAAGFVVATPAHPQSRYVVVDADHRGVPTAAGLVVEWLRGLGLGRQLRRRCVRDRCRPRSCRP